MSVSVEMSGPAAEDVVEQMPEREASEVLSSDGGEGSAAELSAARGENNDEEDKELERRIMRQLQSSFKKPVSYFTGCSAYRICALPMTAVVFGLVACTYIPYVLRMPHQGFIGGFEMFGFHVCIVLLLSSYLQTTAIDPGTVPQEWAAILDKAPESITRGKYRRCRRCNMWKPPRSHYDSVTQRIVLNMDHFCPWVANTVGFYNRKFFVLFLFYTILSCAWYISAVGIRSLALGQSVMTDEAGDHSFLKFMAFVIDSALVITLICFLGFHIKLVITNETTIDEGCVPEYDVGWRRNVEQVFGSNPWLWAFPIYGSGPVGDGVNWPTNEEDESSEDDGTHLLKEKQEKGDSLV